MNSSKRKKNMIWVLLVAMTAMLFSGCTPEQASSPKAEEPVTITFWHNYDAGAGQIEVLEALIAEFEAENPDIKVDHLYLEWSALKNNVVAGATTKMLPDVLRGDIGFVPLFQSLNVLVEMDTRFDDYAKAAETIMDAPNSTAAKDGHYYGLAANTNTKIFYYNKDLVSTPPANLDEMWDIAESISNDDLTGFVEAWMGGWNLCQYIWSNGGDVLAPDYSTAEGYINGPAAVKVIQRMADLHAKGAFNGPSIDPGAPGDTDGMGTEKYAMTIDGPWKAKDFATKYPDLNIGTMQMPAGEAGSIGVLGGEDFMMFESSDEAHQEASWKFIKFMTGKHAQIEMAKVGQMPVNREALDSQEALDAMPLLPIFAEALKTCRTRPVIPQWSDVSGIINTKATEAVLGIKPVQTALDEAAQEIDAVLAK